MDRGILYGVSVGPGDPELLTIKAVRIIQEADVIAVPESAPGRMTARDICGEHLRDKELLVCRTPMTRDAAVLADAHRQLADRICAVLDRGRSVAYLCLGDVGIYSTFSYVRDLVEARGHRTEAVPGVTSFCAAAATLGTALCAESECLTIAPSSSAYLDDALDLPGPTVIMKPGRSLAALRERLSAHGRLDDARVVCRCGMPDEQVFERLEDCPDDAGYLSVVIAGGPTPRP